MSETYSLWQNKNWQADVAILNSLHGGHICIYCNIGEAKIQQRIDRFCSFSLSGLLSAEKRIRLQFSSFVGTCSV